MSKSSYDEALEELRCATVDLEDLEIIHSYDVSKIENALKLGKLSKELLELYKQLTRLYEKLYTMELSELSLNSNYYEIEIIKLKQRIKELENEWEDDDEEDNT